MENRKDKAKRFLFKSDFRRATVLSTIPSLILDLFFIGFNFLIGVWMLSLWNIIMCIYYVMLTLMRIDVLARSAKVLFSKDKSKAYLKLYRSTHRLLLLLDIMLAGAIYFLLDNNIWKSYPGIVIYVVGFYTLYKVTASVINLFRARKANSITTVLLRKIGHADSLVSLLVLESAIIGRSGRTRSFDIYQIALISGCIVCGIIFFIAFTGIIISRSKVERTINS
ncbi:MAG: hypothetical protein K6F49_05065 [Saccharofermentans sp.]|nr:hypothetical protein [Saccharofermentans sp.]